MSLLDRKQILLYNKNDFRFLITTDNLFFSSLNSIVILYSINI